jgi:hypothetical protein
MSKVKSHHRFAVDPVAAATKPLPTEKAKVSVERLLGTPVEACDSYSAAVVRQPGFHALIAAAHLAYQHHYPLTLTPDAIWLTLAQGLANHVNLHAERLRPLLVRHADRPTVIVRRDDFVRGSAENPWAEVWPAFTAAIREYLTPEVHGLVTCGFSTTGPTERAASEVVLLDCVQSYFNYRFLSRCGIPEVSLEGAVEDWEEVHRRAGRLGQYELGWWADEVQQITAEFVAAARGRPSRAFWRAIYKQEGSSGGPYTQGWMVRLLPYLKHREFRPAREGDYSSGSYTPWRTDLKNPLLGRPFVKRGHFAGLTDDRLPSSASQVPFVWEYLGQEYPYQFVAGVLAVAQDPDTLAIRPRVGWAVRPATAEEPEVEDDDW